MTSNALALPLPTLESGSDRAAALLSASTKSKLAVSRSTSGDWILSPSSDLTATELRVGVAALELEMAGGPEQRIAAALMKLISATRRPAWMDDEIAEHYFEAVQEAMLDYPIDIVEAACIAWRKGPSGEFWPAEKELRRICDEQFKPRRDLRDGARSLLNAMESQERRGNRERSSQPRGATLALVNACLANPSFGSAFVRSYLSSRTCDFSDDTVFTMSIVAERLQQRAGGLLAKHGVKVKVCPHTTERIYADEDARAADNPNPKKRKAWGQ